MKVILSYTTFNFNFQLSIDMIQTEGITKSFGSLQVLKGIDLTIGEGEIVAIVGPSGAGKTTLLQIIGTLDAPDNGKLYINGTETVRLSEEKLAAFRNRNIGFVFQFHQLLPEFTALENVMIPALIAREKTGCGGEESEGDPRLHEPGRPDVSQTERIVGGRETARSRCPRPYQQPVRHPCRRTVGKPGYQEQGRTAQALLRPAQPDAPDIRDRHARRAIGNRYGPRDPYQRRNGSIDN